MSAEDVPESAIRAVSKKLKQYIDKQRREEGFDTSPVANRLGNFSCGTGTAGTFHYNSLQDRHLQHYFDQPLMRRQLEELGVVHPGMIKPMTSGKRRTRSAGEQQRHSTAMENKRLLSSAARLLLSSGYGSYYGRPGSACDSSVCDGSRQTSSRQSSQSTVSSSKSRSRTTTPKASGRPSRSSHSSVQSQAKPTGRPGKPCVCTCSCSTRLRSVSNDKAKPGVMKYSIGVCTAGSTDASTQTPVSTSTQTELSRLFDNSVKLKPKSTRSPHTSRTQSRDQIIIDNKVESLTIHELVKTNGGLEKLKQFIKQNSSLVNSTDDRGNTPLHLSCLTGNSEHTKVLGEAGSDLTLETPTGYTAVHCAAMGGHTQCLKVLLSLGCDMNCPTVDNQTPLHLAAKCGMTECCQWLLSNGAVPSLEDNGGRTAIDLAMDGGYEAIVSALTEYHNVHL